MEPQFRKRLVLVFVAVQACFLSVQASGDALSAFPVFKATLLPSSSSSTSQQQWNSPCFLQNSAYIVTNPYNGTIYLDAREKSERLCSDLYLIANEDGFFTYEVLTEGKHVIPIGEWKDGEYDDVLYFGYQVFLITDGMIGEIEDIYAVWEYFDPKNDNNTAMVVEFLEENAGWTFTLRPPGNTFIPDPKDIKSGDYLAIADMDDGVSMLIMYGTGGKTSHTAVALWHGDELFICESAKDGVGCTPYSEYFALGHEGFREDSPRLMALLRLAPEYLSQFDEERAWEWFQTVDGLPYGYQNFLFGWIDTAYDNYPPPLTEELLVVAAPLLDKVKPEYAIIYNPSFNVRMGTYNFTTEEIFKLLEDRNMSFTDLMTIVERDDFIYPDIPYPHRAMVCDSFVLAMYKAAGVFDHVTTDWHASELTPKDSYQLNIFDANWDMPEGCPRERGVSYCQVNGMYYLDLDEFNTIDVYDHMNERCGAMPKEYVRGPEGC